MPNRSYMKGKILIILLAILSISSSAQNRIISDNINEFDLRTILTSSVNISHEIAQFSLSFSCKKVEDEQGVFLFYALLKCRQCDKAWYIDKDSFLAIEHPNGSTTYCKAYNSAKPQVKYDKEAKKAFFDWDAEYTIPLNDYANISQGISSCLLQLRNSDNHKSQVKLIVPKETSEEIQAIFNELKNIAGL